MGPGNSRRETPSPTEMSLAVPPEPRTQQAPQIAPRSFGHASPIPPAMIWCRLPPHRVTLARRGSGALLCAGSGWTPSPLVSRTQAQAPPGGSSRVPAWAAPGRLPAHVPPLPGAHVAAEAPPSRPRLAGQDRRGPRRPPRTARGSVGGLGPARPHRPGPPLPHPAADRGLRRPGDTTRGPPPLALSGAPSAAAESPAPAPAQRASYAP